MQHVGFFGVGVLAVFDTLLAPEQILTAAGALWLGLFAIGIYRMGGDVMGAVFPIDGRAGATMWGRDAVASSAGGFLISFAGYLFNAVTAFLGVLVFFQRTTAWRVLAGAMFAITLPYFFLAGARSHFLAAVLPFILTYLFYGRHLLILKLAILAIAFFCLNEGFKFVTAFRGTGFREVLASENPYELMDEDMRTSGLNMIQELCFVNTYLETGGTSPAYGARYLNELLNFIPRVIWPSKPLIGFDYAKWRGLESPDNELGVVRDHFQRNDRRRRFELWSNLWSGRSQHAYGPLDWCAHLLVGTKKIAPAPGVVHAWRRSYLQPRPGHQPAGALARHICILFCPTC